MKKTLLIIFGIILSPIILPGVIIGLVVMTILDEVLGDNQLAIIAAFVIGLGVSWWWAEFLFKLLT